jgi:hypothetical protein
MAAEWIKLAGDAAERAKLGRPIKKAKEPATAN